MNGALQENADNTEEDINSSDEESLASLRPAAPLDPDVLQFITTIGYPGVCCVIALQLEAAACQCVEFH